MCTLNATRTYMGGASCPLVAVRVVGTVMWSDAGRVPLMWFVLERFGGHLVRTVWIVGAVGWAEAGRITGFGVWQRDGRLLVMVAVRAAGRMALITGPVLLRVVVVVVVVMIAVIIDPRLSVRGQQHVVAVRIIRAQGRVQSGRVPGSSQHCCGLDRKNDGLGTWK